MLKASEHNPLYMRLLRGVALVVLILVFPVGVNLLAANLNDPLGLALLATVIAVTGVAALLQGRLDALSARAASEHAVAAEQEAGATFQDLFDSVFGSSAPSPTELTLVEEVGAVSNDLSKTVRRLGALMNKAQAFEAEVMAMVARAESAEATVKINEEDARRISLIMGAAAQETMRADLERMTEKFEKMTTEHALQLENLRTSGRRMAIWTFAGGVLLGMVGNVLVALIMN